MRAIAEFAMRSRVRAVILTLVGIPLISPAVLALVGLRRGSGDGLFVLAWALLPAVVTMGVGAAPPQVVGLAIAHLVAVLAGALILRATKSWPFALFGLVAVAGLATVAASSIGGGFLADLQDSLEPLFASIGVDRAALEAGLNSEIQASGFRALELVVASVLALLLGRWWQAKLYNPGGLREEMHALRMPLPITATGILLWIYCLTNEHLVFWGLVLVFPILVAGICLIHWMVAQKDWGLWGLVLLIAMYLMLVISTPPIAGFLCGLALIDSWIDIRARSGNNR